MGFMMIYCTDKCPKYALCKPNTPLEAPPPAPTLGAGDLIDGGRCLDLDQRTDHTAWHKSPLLTSPQQVFVRGGT